MEDLIILLAFMSPLCLVLAIGGVIADYILPHIKPLNRWLDSLPDYEEDNEQ
ncbi:MAG: hypothetical protein GX918_04815 [Clostridiales bacterium]|jgi:hypothetical protein|nr:hypothetical protein [Clostridiales bacterium]